MSHQRTLIRRAAVAALLDKTAAQERVYPTRKVPYRQKELPVIAVYTDDEESDTGDVGPLELERNIDLKVEAWVATDGDPEPNVDDAMDDIALEIEAALHGDLYLGGEVGGEGLKLTGSTTDLVTVGDLEIGLVVLTYQATYYTQTPEATPDGELEDFEDVAVTLNEGGLQAPADDTHDQFTVEAP